MFDLKDKVAVVTGASSGLGADAAKAYGECGAKVAILARRKNQLDQVAEEMRAKGAQVLTVQCDVSKEESVKSAVEEVLAQFGKIDILLNNAGVAVGGAVDTMSEEDWDRSMDINVKGIYLMCKYVVPQMKERRYGKIVNIASVNAFVADKADTFVRHSYITSKKAVIGLTEAMAASYGKYNITVNSVCPGLFESEMTQTTLFQSEQFLNGYNHLCPMCRPGAKGEINGPVLFFSSDMSSYVTGQYVIADGGFTLV